MTFRHWARIAFACLTLGFLARQAQARPSEDDLKRIYEGTAMIHAVRDGKELGRGAGIILGGNQEAIYILTAAHVLKDEDGNDLPLSVRFYKQQQRYEAALRAHFPFDVDAAVIEVKRDKRPELDKYANVTLRINTGTSEGAASNFYERIEKRNWPERLWVVGNAQLGWSLSSELPRRSVEPDGILMSSGDLVPGFSGGPVFDEAGQIVGMYLGKDGTARAYRIDNLLYSVRSLDILEANVIDDGISVSRRTLLGLHGVTRLTLAALANGVAPEMPDGAAAGYGLGLTHPSPIAITDSGNLSLRFILSSNLLLGAIDRANEAVFALLLNLDLEARYEIDGVYLGAGYTPTVVVIDEEFDFTFRAAKLVAGYQPGRIGRGGIGLQLAQLWGIDPRLASAQAMYEGFW